MVGYVMKLQPGWLCLTMALINCPMYTMEMKYIFTGKLSITAMDDDLGPCEIEIIITSVFFLAGLFGYEGLGDSIGTSLGIEMIPKFLLWKHALSSIFVILLCFFTLENVYSCIKQDIRRAIHYLSNPLICLVIPMICASLGSTAYTEQFVIFHLMYSFVFDISSYRLMLTHMTNSYFNILGLEHILAVIPLITLLLAPEYEVAAT